MIVPSRPQTTVRPPATVPALATDIEPKRTRNVGNQVEMPPTAKVHIARPSVAHQNAGLRVRPDSVARLKVGASESALPRLGSRTKKKASAISAPGSAAMKKGARQP